MTSNATVSATAILGGVNRGNNSPAFTGGNLAAILGGCEIDLRQASIDGEAVIDVFALWGGIEIRVPEDWTVVVAGGADPRRRRGQDPAAADGVGKRLVVRGFVIMAGVEMKN